MKKAYKIFLSVFIGIAGVYLLLSIYHYSYLLNSWAGHPNFYPGFISKLIFYCLFLGLVVASLATALSKRRILSLSLGLPPTIMYASQIIYEFFAEYTALTVGLKDPGDLFSFIYSIIDTTFTSLILSALIIHIIILIIGIKHRKSTHPTAKG